MQRGNIWGDRDEKKGLCILCLHIPRKKSAINGDNGGFPSVFALNNGPHSVGSRPRSGDRQFTHWPTNRMKVCHDDQNKNESHPSSAMAAPSSLLLRLKASGIQFWPGCRTHSGQSWSEQPLGLIPVRLLAPARPLLFPLIPAESASFLALIRHYPAQSPPCSSPGYGCWHQHHRYWHRHHQQE